MRRPRHWSRTGLAGVLAVAMLATSCSDKKDDSGTAATSPETAASTAPNGSTAAPGETTATDDTAPESTVAETPQVGGKLIVAGEAEAGSPWTPEKLQCDSFCQMRARTFFEPLMALGTDLEVHPVLAESVTPNDDFTVWTVTLRDGITFHDGTPLDADAAIKNLQQAGRGLVISAGLSDVARNPDGTFKIDKVDDLTFTITLGRKGDPDQPRPWPTFPYALTTQWGFMASPTWLDAAAADPAKETQPVGTGPFVFDSFTPGDTTVVKRNPDYWRQDENGAPLPYLDEIEFRVIADSLTRAEALKAGDVDLIATSDSEVIADFRSMTDEFPMLEQTELTDTNHVLLNLTQPVLQDKRVRCAMGQAVDKQALIDTFGGIATPANGPFSPGQEGYLDDNGSLPYDPEAAKALIDDYVAESGQTPKIVYTPTPDTNAQVTAQFLQQAWQEIGIDVEVRPAITQSKLITNALFGDPDFVAYGWRNHAGVLVDNQYLWWHQDTALPPGQLALNYSRLDDPLINDLLERARGEIDPDVRRDLAEQVNRRFAEECYLVPLSYTIWGIPHRPEVRNLGNVTLPDGSTARPASGVVGLVNVWKGD